MPAECFTCKEQGQEECFWCETPYCAKCVEDKKGAYLRNKTYVVCSFCDEVPIDGKID